MSVRPNNLSEPGWTNTVDPAQVKPKTRRFTRTSKTQATFSTQRRLLFWTKKNVGLKEVCKRQFGREWSSHHLTRKGDYVFSCHMRGTRHWRTSLAVYHITSQPVHKPDKVRRFRTQRRNVLNVSPVFDLFFFQSTEWKYVDVRSIVPGWSHAFK